MPDALHQRKMNPTIVNTAIRSKKCSRDRSSQPLFIQVRGESVHCRGIADLFASFALYRLRCDHVIDCASLRTSPTINLCVAWIRRRTRHGYCRNDIGGARSLARRRCVPTYSHSLVIQCPPLLQCARLLRPKMLSGHFPFRYRTEGRFDIGPSVPIDIRHDFPKMVHRFGNRVRGGRERIDRAGCWQMRSFYADFA